ncbi:LPXTG cell wall anchor domain-containing protein (plasmid) [Enterococcus sp. 22-H-5-01]|uniref:LPXTG cell wall anchor domain-containing protein n=1 Tax=Enterococcus sp. 22-H-5-01 TaxID=3418555 RepID=UPI003D00EA64
MESRRTQGKLIKEKNDKLTKPVKVMGIAGLTLMSASILSLTNTSSVLSLENTNTLDHVSISTKSVAETAAPTADATNSAATNNGVANNQTSTVENSTDQNQSNNQQVITAETATSTTNNQNQTPQMVEQSSDANSAAIAGLTAPDSEQQPSTPEKQLDYTALNAAMYAGAQKLYAGTYTATSVNAYNQAFNNAKAAKGNMSLSQAQVDQITQALVSATAGLTAPGSEQQQPSTPEKQLDYTALNAAMYAGAQKLYAGTYTATSVNAYNQAFNNAKAAKGNMSLSQAQVDQITQALVSATAGLTVPGSEQQPSTPEKQLDFTALNKAIMEGNRVQFKAPYTEETNAAFKKAMNQAKHVMTNSKGNMTQADIDQAEKGLTAAIAGLKVIGGTGDPDVQTPTKELDFTALNKAIMEGNRVQFKAPYTEETNTAFKKAMNQAKHVMTNSDGNMTQADIDQAEKDLTAAIAGLKVIGGTGDPDSRGIDDPKDQTDPKKLPETDNKEQDNQDNKEQDNQNDNDKKALSNKGKEVLSLGQAESNQANKNLSAISNPVSKNVENSSTKPEAKQLSRVEKYNSNSLPKTGMENNVVTSIVGLVMTLFVSLGLIKSTRTKTRKH